MGSTVKLANDLYLETSSIVHNGKLLSNILYPIGSIYLSVNSINPTNFFGGTWEQIKDKFLLACGSTYSAGSTGGEATHKLTMKELPGDVVGGGTNNKSWATGAWNNYSGYAYVYTTINDSNNTSTGGTNSQPHNNMPPYLAVYVWKRVS